MIIKSLSLRFWCWFLSLHVYASLQNDCPPPHAPKGGWYRPKKVRYLPEEKVTYSCHRDGHLLVGKRISRCTARGKWSTSAPFCDVDEGSGSDFHFDEEEESFLTHRNVTSGNSSFAINAGTEFGTFICTEFERDIYTDQWIVLKCQKHSERATYIEFTRTEDLSVCEIEIYAVDGDACPKAPVVRIQNGHLRFNRTKGRLHCSEQFTIRAESEMLCKNNSWKSANLWCDVLEKECSNEDYFKIIAITTGTVLILLIIALLGIIARLRAKMRKEEAVLKSMTMLRLKAAATPNALKINPTRPNPNHNPRYTGRVGRERTVTQIEEDEDGYLQPSYETSSDFEYANYAAVQNPPQLFEMK